RRSPDGSSNRCGSAAGARRVAFVAGGRRRRRRRRHDVSRAGEEPPAVLPRIDAAGFGRRSRGRTIGTTRRFGPPNPRVCVGERPEIMELHQPEAPAREGRAVEDRQRPSLALRAANDTPSPFRAWFALVAVSLQRQARMRQMVWIALGLLLLTTAIVAPLRHPTGRGPHPCRWPR